MSFSAIFYSVAKKQNSTAIPSSGGTTYDISIKDVTNIMKPVISVNAANPTVYNYLRIATFNRYYWVTDWVYDSGLWYGSCLCDVLATYKYAIGATTAYIKRCSSFVDTNIIDVYPRKAGSKIRSVSSSSGMISNLSDMIYIIGVTSASTTAAVIGTTVYYAVSYVGVREFIGNLVSMGYASFTDITDNLAKWVCNPFQWIKSVVVLPFAWSGVSSYGWSFTPSILYGADENAAAFSFNPTGGAYIVNSATSISSSGYFTIPKHPDIDGLHRYLQAEPLSNYAVHFPPYGKFNVASACLYDMDRLYHLIRVDPVTGGGTLYLSPATSSGDWEGRLGVAGVYEAQIGVSLPVDAAIVDFASAGFGSLIGGIIGGSATAATQMANGDGSNLEGITTAFIDGALNAMSKVQMLSSGGKLCDLGLPPALYLEYFSLVGEDAANYGYPYSQRRQIADCSGFILCDHAEVEISGATYNEQREIEAYMNGGFFYE